MGRGRHLACELFVATSTETSDWGGGGVVIGTEDMGRCIGVEGGGGGRDWGYGGQKGGGQRASREVERTKVIGFSIIAKPTNSTSQISNGHATD